jgi:hypothetical protein
MCFFPSPVAGLSVCNRHRSSFKYFFGKSIIGSFDLGVNQKQGKRKNSSLLIKLNTVVVGPVEKTGHLAEAKVNEDGFLGDDDWIKLALFL